MNHLIAAPLFFSLGALLSWMFFACRFDSKESEAYKKMIAAESENAHLKEKVNILEYELFTIGEWMTISEGKLKNCKLANKDLEGKVSSLLTRAKCAEHLLEWTEYEQQEKEKCQE